MKVKSEDMTWVSKSHAGNRRSNKVAPSTADDGEGHVSTVGDGGMQNESTKGGTNSSKA